MKYLLCFFLTAFLFSCNNEVSQKKLSQFINIESVKGDYDFKAIGDIVADKKIVAIGESSHGIGDFYHFKSEFVQYLHREHGFDVIAIEAGLGDVNLAWADVDSLSGQELIKSSLFGNFQCAEVEGLFDYIKLKSNTEDQLIYTGFDSQTSSSYFKETIIPILSRYDAGLADSLDYRLYAHIRGYQAGLRGDSVMYVDEAALLIKTTEDIISIFENHELEIKSLDQLSDFEIEVIKRTADGLRRSAEVPYAEKWRSMGLRDEIMFDNIQWLVNKVYKDKKVIVWAHNGHLERHASRTNSFKWLGHFLAETYRDNYYSLGLFAQEGDAYMHWQNRVIPFNNTDSTMIEQLALCKGCESSFIDISAGYNPELSWVRDTVQALEMESNGIISFVTEERFDGVVVLKNVKAPTFDH